jgi:hypothetical protein
VRLDGGGGHNSGRIAVLKVGWLEKKLSWAGRRISSHPFITYNIRGVQTGGFSPGFGGKTSRSFDAKTSRKNPCVETSPEVLLLFL